MADAVIVDVVRTAAGRGRPGGALSGVHPADLLARTLSELAARNSLSGSEVDDVIAGCVSQVGDQALNIGRTAALAAGLPETVPAVTIDRQCGSSQQAVHFAAQGVMAGSYDVVLACGVESMSRVAMGSANDGGEPLAPLAARYPAGLIGQGVAADLVASHWGIGRSELDEFAAESHERAGAASAAGAFERETVPVHLTGSDQPHLTDETIRPGTTVDRLAGLGPAFRTDTLAERFPQLGWHTTAGNSSPLTDGAAAALIMSAERAAALGLRPRAAFRSFAVTGSDPTLMLTGVIPATRSALQRAGLRVEDIDTFEVNEAFAAVPLAWNRELGADVRRLNPRGGAIALGHPLGASGTRLLTTMLHHLEDTGGRFGLQTMCEGGGMANAMVIERLG